MRIGLRIGGQFFFSPSNPTRFADNHHQPASKQLYLFQQYRITNLPSPKQKPKSSQPAKLSTTKSVGQVLNPVSRRRTSQLLQLAKLASDSTTEANQLLQLSQLKTTPDKQEKPPQKNQTPQTLQTHTLSIDQ